MLNQRMINHLLVFLSLIVAACKGAGDEYEIQLDQLMLDDPVDGAFAQLRFSRDL